MWPISKGNHLLGPKARNTLSPTSIMQERPAFQSGTCSSMKPDTTRSKLAGAKGRACTSARTAVISRAGVLKAIGKRIWILPTTDRAGP